MHESKDEESVLTNRFYTAFGAIIHECARYEYVMVGVVAKILGLRTFQASVMFADLPYRGKLATFKAILKLHDLSVGRREKIIWFLGNMAKHNQFRNHIAHSTWKRGTRPESVKPFGCSVRNSVAEFIGVDDNEPDYTLKDIEDIALDLIKNRADFVEYLRKESLLAGH